MNRRYFSKISTLTLGAGLSTAEEAISSKPLLTLGLLTDLHYADKKQGGSRAYRETLVKAKEAMALFKEKKVSAVICLGDLIDAAPSVDEEISYLTTITGVLAKSGLPRYHVPGNHCVATLNKKEFFKHAGTVNKTGHHSCDLSGVHLVILDACYNSKMESYGRNNAKWHDSNLPPAQIEWLKKDLAATDKPTVVFIHQRLDLDQPNRYAVKQSAEVRKILKNSKKVKAVFQGHSHKNELTEITGVPYCTLAALVEGNGVENNSYSLLHVHEDGTLTLEGFRRQVSRTFKS